MWGQRVCAERTPNMLLMPVRPSPSTLDVTLDVSRLSGWLNDCADCRVEKRAYGAARDVWAGRRESVRRPRRKWHASRGGPD